jgi:hypothetical protein
MGQEVIMAHYVRHSSLSRDPLQGREEKWGKGFLWKRRKSVEKGDLSLGRLQGSLCSGSSVSVHAQILDLGFTQECRRNTEASDMP